MIITKEYARRLKEELEKFSKSKLRIVDKHNTTKGAMFLFRGSEIGLLRVLNAYRFNKNVKYRKSKVMGDYLEFIVPSFKFEVNK